MGKKHCFLGVLASLFILFFAGNVHASTSETLCERGTYLSGTECLECPQNASCPGGDASFTCDDGYAQSGNTCIKEGSTSIKITFNKNGGIGSLGNSTGTNEYIHSCISGELCRFPDTSNLTYLEDGYYLAGWSTDNKCENVEYTNSGTFYKSTTLYACWQSTAVQCLAGYYYDGQTQQPCESGWYCPGTPGENNDCRVQCPDAEEYTIYSDPLADSIFDCYIISDPYDKFEHGTASANCYIKTNTEKNYGNCIIQKIYDCDPGYEPDEKDPKDKKCVASTFNAIYDCGDGQGEKQTNTGTYDSEYTILGNFCTYPGYNFTSWFDGEKYRNSNISITWKYLNDVKFTAQWELCELNMTATGTCGCEKTQYPNGSGGCSDCETSCATNPKFNLGSYNVCNKETALDNCYRLCTIDDVPNASEVEGQVSQSGSQTCYPVLCNPDYYLSDTTCIKCPENAICNGELGFSCKEGYELSEDKLSCVPKTYKITLNKNGGTGDILGSTGTNNATTSCQHGKSCTLPSTGLTKEGFEFTGWGENADCSSGGYTFTFTSEKTMYACWSQTTVQCRSGQYYNGTEFETCPTSGMYCTGTGFANVGTPGCSTTCPEGFAGSEYGSTEITKCYVLCPDPEEFHGGQAQAYKPREYYDTETGKYPACRIEINCDYGYYGTGNQTPDARCNDCPPGYVCNGGYGNTEPEPCPEGQVCTQFEQFSCPEGGTSDVGASDISECYKVCPESVDIENGTAISTGNKNYDKDSEKYPDCEYTVTCDENYKPKAVVSSDPGCVWANPEDCPANHFCPPEADEPIPCPQGGQSEPGSTSPERCYKIFRPYIRFEHGEASAKCYLSNESKYDSNCTIVDVHTCDAGYWYNERENEWACSPVDSAYYSPEDALVQTPCPTDPTFTIGSDPLADAVTQCYKNCTLTVPNASNVIPDQTKAYALDDSGYNKCAFTVICNAGYVPNGNGSENPSCTEETYTVILNKNGGRGSSVPESITCNFGAGKTCILPETAGLTRTGYAVGSDWCSDEKGGTPCYTGGTGITLAAFGKETTITLYATWNAEVYSVKLNNDDADTPSVPNTIYLKYETGWYSDSGAQTVLNKLTTLPTKTGYTFAGYYSTDKGEVQIINNDGALQTSEDALTFTSTSTSINPRWATGVVTCAAGTYYPGTGSSCLPCTENNYCPGGKFATDSGHPDGINACPNQGLSPEKSTSASMCYKTNLVYNATHGDGTQTCYYNESSSTYSSNCKDKVITACDAGYYYNSSSNTTDCVEVGIGYYSPEDALVQTACPTDPTFTIGSDPLAYAVTQCYKNCTLTVPNASSVIPDQTKAYALDESGYNKCAFTVNCEPGYVPNGNGSENPSCTEETYTVILNKNGGSGSSVPESITCNFGAGKTCILPETAGLTRTGYAVGPDWCSDEKGGTPCYTGGTGITLAAFGKETTITLYATWDAEVYSIKLNNDDADTPSVPNTIYLKYETGWYSDSGAQTVLNKLTTLPTKTGYTFAGYYSTDKGEVQIINNDGALQTSEDALTFTSTNTSINPRWATGVVTCAAGTYYPGTGSSCLPCTENNYCPGGEFATDSGHQEGINACPNQGLSPEKSTSASMCYKTNLVYNATHGDGTQTCYYNESSSTYSSNCKDKVITACDAGYYYNSSSNTTDCVEVGMGYYSPASIITKSQCPQSGTTATSTSAAVTECFKNNLPCTITSGTGTNTCYYSETSSSYTSNCSTCLVAACDPGYYLVDGECVKCPAGNVCNAEGKKTCASLTGGIYPESDAGISDVAMCYKNCTLPANAASVTGRDYYTAPDTCEIIKCKAGYTLDNGACVKCPAGSFCDGSTTPVIPGEDAKSCTKLGDGSWNMSAAGATNENDCYKVCEEYDVVGGIGIPLNDTVFYPNSCQFKYVSDSGEPCELIDGICVVTSCKPGYEKIGEDCVPCNVEFAKTYKSTGVCQVDSCVIGYHPRGRACEEDIKECSLPNVEYATQSWDYKLNAFGPCTVKECGEGYHVASNACVSDVQPCSIENGIGYKEWDHYSKTWGKCIATSCAPGYTNDPSETDEPIKPCGECRNRYSVLGQLAVSSYVKGCEIASCMYQGELYNLENNECVPICPQEEYEDETGTMVWDQSRKKCVRTCKEGYTMW